MKRAYSERGRVASGALSGVLICAFLLASSVAVGFARDPDGSRMQARKHALGESSSDSLAPPGDSVDWRYVKLSEKAALRVELSSRPTTSNVRVLITSAVGKEIASTTSSGGSIQLSRTLAPGLYYVSVSCTDAVRYTVTIH